MVDFALAFSTAAQALKLAQDLRGIEKAFDAAELKLKVADLTTALADLKVALTEARDDLHEKDLKIAKLEKLLARVADTVEVHGFKYAKTADGKPKGHPFCPICEQKDGRLYNLVASQALPGRPALCPACKGNFGDAPTYADE